MEKRKAKICVPVRVRRFDELPGAMQRAAEVADLIEVRLDYLSVEELTQRKWEIPELLRKQQRPVILTLRPAEFGGARSISLQDRIRFRRNRADGTRLDGFAYWDVEDDFAHFIRQREDQGWGHLYEGSCEWKTVIVSHHDFDGVPDIDSMYEYLRQWPAAVVKIAVKAEDALDCLPVFKLLERAQRDGREMIAIAMGQAGVMTRILGPSRRSFLTYGSLDEDTATAPGQLTARELREVYRIDQIDPQTEIFGVIGRPIHHSISPRIHNAAFASANLSAVFIPIEVHDLESFIGRMVRRDSREIDWNLRGLSVTAPHKTAVMKYLDWIEDAAKEIGAVNTIVVKDGALRGYNTDALGFIGPLKNRLDSLEGVRCAVIGAGGAARAVVWALRNEGAKVELFARNHQKAAGITKAFDVDCHPLTDAVFREFEVVVNATPLGTRNVAETETPAITEQLRGVRLAYDLVYNPVETRFIREARAAGCETIGGLEMLIGQAVEQFKLWTGVAPSPETMRTAAVNALNQRSSVA